MVSDSLGNSGRLVARAGRRSGGTPLAFLGIGTSVCALIEGAPAQWQNAVEFTTLGSGQTNL
jgi:hypothetical protein